MEASARDRQSGLNCGGFLLKSFSLGDIAQRADYAGTLACGRIDHGPSLARRIANRSSTALSTATATGWRRSVPDEFVLFFSDDGIVQESTCKVTWRFGDEVGAKFVAVAGRPGFVVREKLSA
jgi:hypothetical protein